ncbi:outer dense fiber of sperm tails 3 [Phyllostomus discolor]|uniref:Outer dense fiber of sperm tails 3 n=1 Tax=Phyllostomus discolor TaxID=89673 RepID=A0A6J2M2B1_9CHIR|nr:outer dense fiber protein 3 isoform X1 [Phyllostomus discolor]KAF6105226.1 outer dense fiber of sperm tails 3 [Phyllostomus discolor]
MVEDVWVGSWRPHRPRGPIMALYSSPGPKYMIPPTTGFVKHTPTKVRAPAYSFRGAPMLLSENCSPGPRYSVNPKILRTGKDYGPAFSILGRYHTKTMLTPGPGDYFPERSTKHVFDSAPSHSISARTRTFRVDSTPGPAAYMLPAVMGPHSVGKASQPSFSIKGRSKLGGFSDDLHKTPGPAAYHQTDVQVTKLKAPQYTIAARVEPPGDKTLKPGPGAHSPEKVTLTKPCAPIITFGIKHSDYMTPLLVQTD